MFILLQDDRDDGMVYVSKYYGDLIKVAEKYGYNSKAIVNVNDFEEVLENIVYVKKNEFEETFGENVWEIIKRINDWCNDDEDSGDMRVYIDEKELIIDKDYLNVDMN